MVYKNKEEGIKQHQQIYTDSDKQAFAARDRRITRECCLEHATDLVIACLDSSRVITPEIIQQVVEIASEFFDWVYEDKVVDVGSKSLRDLVNLIPSDKVDVDVSPLKSDVIVQPSDAEKKIIYQVAHTLNDKLTEQKDKRVVDVMKLTRWIYETYSKYPTQQQSIQKILNNPGIECCMIENNFAKGL